MQELSIEELDGQNVPAEEAQEQQLEQEAVEVPSEPEREYSELEKQALEQGWDPSGKMGAEAWIVKGEMIKEKREVQKTLSQFKKEINNIKKLSYEQAKKELEENLRNAVNNADYNKVQQLHQEMNELQKDAPIEPNVQQAINIPEVEEFLLEYPEIVNPKTPEDFAKQAFVRKLDSDYDAANPGDYVGNINHIREQLEKFNLAKPKPKSAAAQRREQKIPETVPSHQISSSKNLSKDGMPKDISCFTEEDLKLAKSLAKNKVYGSPAEYLEEIRPYRVRK